MKNRFFFTRLIFISAIVFLIICTNASASIILNMCALPSTQGWKYVSGGNSIPEKSIFSIQNLDKGCILHQDSMGVGQANQGSNGYLIYNVVDPSKPFVLKIKARVLAEEGDINSNHFGFCIGVGTGAEAFAIAIGPSTIQATDNENENRVLSTSIDNTKFHNYRLEGNPGIGYKLYVDNDLVATGDPKVIECDNRLYLGDGTGGTNAKADVASFEFIDTDDTNRIKFGEWSGSTIGTTNGVDNLEKTSTSPDVNTLEKRDPPDTSATETPIESVKNQNMGNNNIINNSKNTITYFITNNNLNLVFEVALFSILSFVAFG